VTHETSGLLFRPGDVADLRRTLRRLIDEPDLLPRLRAAIPAVPTIEQVASRLRALYRDPPPLPACSAKRFAAVVLNFQTPRETVLAVRSLGSSRRAVDDVLVVENASNDDSETYLRSHLPAGVRLLATGRNLGFSGGCNAGIRDVLDRGAELVLLLNGDAMLAADTIGRLEDALANEPEAAIAGPTLLEACDPTRIASQGMAFSRWSGRMRHPEAGRPHDPLDPGSAHRVAAVSGCGMLVERRVFEEAGLFDEDFFFSFEDLDLCLRAQRAGFETLVAPDAIAYHFGSRSIGPTSPRRLYFAARNHQLVARKAAPISRPWGVLRWGLILGWNLAFVARGAGCPRWAGLRNVLRGTLDARRG